MGKCICLSSVKEKIFTLLPILLFFTVFIFFASNNFFFWDTVRLGSIQAHFYYENDFNKLFLPAEHDAGHIAAFGMYLALIWKIFSKSLFVSHMAMFPFIYGIIWQTYLLTKRYLVEKRYVLITLILTLLDPTFLSQTILISPDIPLLFFSLLGLNAVLSNKKIVLMTAIIGLFITNMRGLIITSVLLCLDIILTISFLNIQSVIVQSFKKLLKYLPALSTLFIYQYFHYKETGWIWYHEDSPWIKDRATNNFNEAIYNIGIFIWRIIDFGRLFIYLALILLIIKNKKKIIRDHRAKQLLTIIIFISLGFICLFIYYKYLRGHRYLMPIYFLSTIFVGYVIVNFVNSKRKRKLLFIGLFIGLITGNLWIYPPKIAQGWDSSLAHIPYYCLHKKMIAYINSESIPFKAIGSEFPNLAEQKYISLNNDRRSFKKKNIYSDQLIMYSNIFNDFTDSEIDVLESNFKLRKEFKSFGVFVRLYEK